LTPRLHCATHTAGLEGKKVEAEAYIDKQAERLRWKITGNTLNQREKEVRCLGAAAEHWCCGLLWRRCAVLCCACCAGTERQRLLCFVGVLFVD
jgi:hypothetical protein